MNDVMEKGLEWFGGKGCEVLENIIDDSYAL